MKSKPRTVNPIKRFSLTNHLSIIYTIIQTFPWKKKMLQFEKVKGFKDSSLKSWHWYRTRSLYQLMLMETKFPQRCPLWELTFNDELGSTLCLPCRVTRLNGVSPRILVEHLGDVQRVEVSLLDHLKVRRADDLWPLTIPRDHGWWVTSHADRQTDWLPFTNLLGSESIGEGGWDHGS